MRKFLFFQLWYKTFSNLRSRKFFGEQHWRCFKHLIWSDVLAKCYQFQGRPRHVLHLWPLHLHQLPHGLPGEGQGGAQQGGLRVPGLRVRLVHWGGREEPPKDAHHRCVGQNAEGCMKSLWSWLMTLNPLVLGPFPVKKIPVPAIFFPFFFSRLLLRLFPAILSLLINAFYSELWTTRWIGSYTN